MDETDIPTVTQATSVFDDVPSDAWYGPHVSALYELGLIDSTQSEYQPDSLVSRAEALRLVTDYCDLDLEFPAENSVIDVPVDHPIYPYFETFYRNGKGRIFREQFSPDLPANKNYLKYLVNEC
mgnify:FL=1